MRIAVLVLGASLLGAPCPALGLQAVTSASTDPTKASLEIGFKVNGAPLVPPAGELVLRSVGPGRESISLSVASGKPVATEIKPGRWELVASLPGFWVPAQHLTVAADGETTRIELPLWPAGQLTGSLKLPTPAGKHPEKVEVRFQSPPPAGRMPNGSVLCPIVADTGSWACEIPAGLLDVAVQATGYVPVYRWGIATKAGKPTSLGRLELKAGASVAGWAETADGGLLRCIAKLSPLAAPGGRPSTAERLRSTILSAQVTERGFFQIGGVAPGSYLLEVSQQGYAPARVFPLEVFPGAETSLRSPVVLERPLDLELVITPLADWLGQPWQVQVFRASEFSGSYDREPVFEGAVSAEGTIIVRNQAPGAYWITVRDAAGNRLYSEPDIYISGPQDARRDLEIDLVTVKGEIYLGKEPLAATLHFGGQRGFTSIEMVSDETGEFSGVLPREGRWLVEVTESSVPLSTHTKVEVEANDRGRADIEIRLPDTHVFGRVLDEHDKPVAQASVLVEDETDVIEATTAADGNFDLRAVPAGLARLSARAAAASGGTLSSDSQLVSLAEGQPLGPIELRLRRATKVTGTVVSPRGPVAGASILLLAHQPLLGFGDKARTGLDGKFVGDLPGGTEIAAAIVSPPGHALKVFQFPLEGMEVRLNVPPEGGTLEAVLPSRLEEENLIPLVLQNGVAIPVQALVSWAEGHGVRAAGGNELRIPQLAAGEYRACLVPRLVAPGGQLTAWLEQTGRCASGFLNAGDTLRLEIPAKKGE